MKVFWVLGYDTFYPERDNFRASFKTREQAEEYIAKIKIERERRINDEDSEDDESGDFYIYDQYSIMNISDRL